MRPPQNPTNLTLIALCAIVLLFLYVLPSIIAFARHHYRRWQILAGNLLLGWTFWVWAYCIIVAIGPSAHRGEG